MSEHFIDYAWERDGNLKLHGYSTIEQLGSLEDCVFYRLWSDKEGSSVIAKTTRDPYPDGKTAQSLRDEYERLKRIGSQGALEALGIEEVADRPVVLLKDIGGDLMNALVPSRDPSLPLADLVRVAVSAADSLMRLHREDLVLLGISPSYLWVNVETGEAKFADIRNSSNDRETDAYVPFIDCPRSLQPYLSPEQTGRTGNEPDYRSDLYSLGMTLYEWISGSLPFQRERESDIVYRHLAVAPQLLHREFPGIPETLSRIIGKCLEKSPESRYMSVYGLKLDLENFLAGIEGTGEAPGFEPGERDVPRRFRFPTELYGRIAEREQLYQALDRARSGATEMFEIQGVGGIGKTFFVRETLKEIIHVAGKLATGKFDSNRNALPYGAWIQVIEELTSELLTASTLEIEVWKLRMLKVLEGYGRLLIERVPRLELLIGPQPEVPSLPPVEAKRRFHLILSRFLQVFAWRDRPLVLFLDDLQWADEESLHYLADFLEDRETKHALIVLAYRDEELSAGIALPQLRERLAVRKAGWTSIRLEALGERETEALLYDALRGEREIYGELASMLLRKTAGNPFFLKRFLQDLLDSRAVQFDEDAGRWIWDTSRILEMSVAEDAASYLAKKLAHLPGTLIRTLSRAAFLGNTFGTEQLKSLVGLDEGAFAEALDTAVREGLLQADNRDRGVFRFQHDRIQQAAYEFVSEEERIGLHYRIGMEKLRNFNEAADFDDFGAVHHLNRAAEKFVEERERRELANLNLRAGLKAKQSTAYETALGYIARAMDMLAEASWDEDYELMFLVYRERAELEYLCLHFDEAKTRMGLLLGKAKNKLDQAVIYNLMIQLEASLDNRGEVIELARRTLALLNVDIPARLGRSRLIRQMLRVRRKLRRHSGDTIAKLPPMTDETSKIAMKTLDLGTGALFQEDKNGWLAYTLTMVELTLERGRAPESCIGFIGYALIQYSVFHRMEETYRWGILAWELSKPYPLLLVKTLSVFQICSDSWRKYDREMLDVFSRYSGKVGLESGDIWQGNQSVLIDCVTRFNLGCPIPAVYERLLEHAGEFRRHKNDVIWKEATMFAAMLVRLSGYRAPGDLYPIEEVEQENYTAGSAHLEELSSVCDYIYGYIFEDYAKAEEALKKVADLTERRKDKAENALLDTYEALVWLQRYETLPAEERGERWSAIRTRRNRMRKYARRCPENYLHKLFLIDAEIARLKGKHRRAEELYAKSIEAAEASGHIHDLAIAAECCGKHGLSQGKSHQAKVYLTQAYETYQQWGAYLKIEQMEKKYATLLKLKPETGLDRIDYLSVVQSVQAISGEMEMDSLLNRLMRIMLHNSGAEFGALLFDYEGSWVVEAYGTLEDLRIAPVPVDSVPVEQHDEMPAAVVVYAARTGETVILHDAAREGMFARNPYISNKGVRSVLCLPIWHQNKMISLLYLENKLSPNVFTPQRLEHVKLLASQCAISIANAKLFTGIRELRNNLEKQVEERTRSLERAMLETSAALAEASVYEERNRIAQEIHDIVGHTLTSTVIQIEAGKRLLLKDADEAVNRLKEAQDLVRHSLNEIRGSVHMLKQDKYADLEAQIRQLIEETERNAGVSIRADIDPIPELSAAHRKTIYHALQEGLTNGIRHGSSTEFRFGLRDVGQIIRFRLDNYGKGTDKIVPGFGLKAMRDRVEQLGGSLSVESGSGEGFRLLIELPYSALRTEDNQ
ncbi:AAA family ATPase [Cohnella terricola]|uniref:AAA family ATPase n=1 Tax=Cohnella terricola TaxID=1289167 RepID=A0A559JMQ5_9BACL|nr:AAA family ATPase [Cohnella terricola]TVY01146.1 AAA family ATPase [Cohnella terricola]